MIIGIDHVTFNSNNLKFLKLKNNFKEIYNFISINHVKKKFFLKNFANKHLIIFNKSLDLNPSVEFTSYSNIKKKISAIKVKKNKLYIFSNAYQDEMIFWKDIINIKFNFKYKKLNYFSTIDQKKYEVFFRKKKIDKYYLDYNGYTNICFITTNIRFIFNYSKNMQLENSGLFVIKIKKHRFRVLFLRSKGNIIYEFIEFLN
jgi:hypothetical protein